MEILDIKTFKESFNDLDTPSRLTNKLLYLIDHVDEKYTPIDYIEEVKNSYDIIYSYFNEITKCNRDHLFDDAYLYTIVIWATARSAIKKETLLNSIKESLDCYINSSDEELYYEFSSDINKFFLKDLENTERSTGLFYGTRPETYKDVYSILFNQEQELFFKTFIKLNSVVLKRAGKNPPSKGLAEMVMDFIRSYCIIHKCPERLEEYVKKYLKNIKLIEEIVNLNNLRSLGNHEEFPSRIKIFTRVMKSEIIDERAKIIIK